MNAWFETEPGRRFRLHVASTTGDLRRASLRIVLDDWPPYVDPTPWMAGGYLREASAGKEGWSVQSLCRPKHLITVEDEDRVLGCQIVTRDRDQVTVYVRSIDFTS